MIPMSSFWRSVPGAAVGYWLADVGTRSTAAGAAIYGPLVLGFVYDSLVLGLYCSFVWKCPAIVLEHLYRIMINGAARRRESKKRGTEAQVRILDIGVGTGYYMAKTKLPESTSVTLFDLNTDCLEVASTRCRKAHSEVLNLDIETVCGDFLASDSDPSSIQCMLGPRKQGNKHYDVVFTTFLLHCLPGPPDRKAKALASLSRLVEPTSGVLCGATILGKGSREVCHSLVGRFVLFWHNLLGWFDNESDDTEVFVQALEEAFEIVSCQVIAKTFRYAQRDSYRRHKDNTYIVLNDLGEGDDEDSDGEWARNEVDPDFVASTSFRRSLSQRASRIMGRRRL
ncbi:hypothetical protein N8I77_005978 [Diaporthe amygdali]|uniref:Methyltransferase domain-containing protein n=1 Tax=Phomopsis amygdali TaxID=1214568 RepID=A0AAD9SGU3_PHOAM|nr:hypothetical protein N8I77_005978 [Diaporthe amygdali]